jgi:hypothetical protein
MIRKQMSSIAQVHVGLSDRVGTCFLGEPFSTPMQRELEKRNKPSARFHVISKRIERVSV